MAAWLVLDSGEVQHLEGDSLELTYWLTWLTWRGDEAVHPQLSGRRLGCTECEEQGQGGICEADRLQLARGAARDVV